MKWAGDILETPNLPPADSDFLVFYEVLVGNGESAFILQCFVGGWGEGGSISGSRT